MKIVLEKPQNPNEVHISELEQIPDSFCMNIVLDDVLDYIPNRHDLLLLLIPKLRYEGYIEIYGNDILEITRLIYIGSFDTQEINTILYNGRQSIDSINNMIGLIESTGLIITQKQISDYKYYVRANRIPNTYEL